MEPQVISQDYGRFTADWNGTLKKLAKEGAHEDHSTIIVFPGFASIPTKVVLSWMSMIRPPNQKVFNIATQGMEVGAAYSAMFEMIVAHPDLSQWKYILTIEHDNIPEPDALLKLFESIEGKVDGNKYDAMSGIYFTKGEGGVPQIWGNPAQHPRNFQPMMPIPGAIMHCNGIGMGFALWRIEMFKDTNLRKPWFKTQANFDPSKGAEAFTQDLWFWNDATGKGKKCAVDCRVRVGHYAADQDIVW